MARHTTQGLSTVVRANSSYINGVQKCLHNFFVTQRCAALILIHR